MSISLNSLVRVVKQPDTQKFVNIVGEVGIITEIDGNYATIECFDISGKSTGCGAVTIDCLVLETNPFWISAQKVNQEEKDRYIKNALEYSRRYNEKLSEIAVKHNLSVEQLRVINKDLNELEYV